MQPTRKAKQHAEPHYLLTNVQPSMLLPSRPQVRQTRLDASLLAKGATCAHGPFRTWRDVRLESVTPTIVDDSGSVIAGSASRHQKNARASPGGKRRRGSCTLSKAALAVGVVFSRTTTHCARPEWMDKPSGNFRVTGDLHPITLATRPTE